MPKDSRARRERIRNARRLARAAESDEAREDRRARDRLSRRRARAAESEEARCLRLATNAAAKARRLATESDEERYARLANNAAQQARRRAAESDEVRRARLARNAAQQAMRRAMESDEARDARLSRNAVHQRRRRAPGGFQSNDADELQQTRGDDSFQFELQGEFGQTLMLFPFPRCSDCGALVWKALPVSSAEAAASCEALLCHDHQGTSAPLTGSEPDDKTGSTPLDPETVCKEGKGFTEAWRRCSRAAP